ncbi:hypothetical protein PHYBLDRAFT_175121 [Phycomyces blakesleeanus NRRL 1555(-)]|uniref:Uncharacterized protein n=1 Tax=Phycomyces blakesleeanus (strain ATCC 8743b / DSM 1359 / FGSC 10004 / NBRC 33097 / NRRL 1555) TaxID=763407 RepID=A0A162TEW1_PHYB8|nr:hypothetical protein PHYBLDRAFT_175121 [Phycomyces blakesleeanus NRRL 1555(-)]OAD66573.1 hypothetical protein PHYBLDRAFT_175121 [Phycomyces blakesleeanus NRRL 1555(-)]|eukprot:XP_018284613.1 hypothetical protein PHYBLDRAFT_175121 [Phycomyces blakesleeanus NRRL 1555(-)]
MPQSSILYAKCVYCDFLLSNSCLLLLGIAHPTTAVGVVAPDWKGLELSVNSNPLLTNLEHVTCTLIWQHNYFLKGNNNKNKFGVDRLKVQKSAKESVHIILSLLLSENLLLRVFLDLSLYCTSIKNGSLLNLCGYRRKLAN